MRRAGRPARLTSSTERVDDRVPGANAGVGEDPLRQRALYAAVVAGEEAVPQVVLSGHGRVGERDPGDRRAGHHRGAEPSESGSPPSAAMPSQSAHTSEVAGCKRAASRVAEQPFQRMPAAAGRRAGGRQHRCRNVGRGVAGQQLRSPDPAVRLGVARRRVDAAGRLLDGQARGRDRGVGSADARPDGRQLAETAFGEVLDRGVDRGLGDADVHGGIARHQPVRHQLGKPERQALDAAEQRRRRYGHVEVQVMRAGRAHAQRVPRLLDAQPVARRPGPGTATRPAGRLHAGRRPGRRRRTRRRRRTSSRP